MSNQQQPLKENEKVIQKSTVNFLKMLSLNFFSDVFLFKPFKNISGANFTKISSFISLFSLKT